MTRNVWLAGLALAVGLSFAVSSAVAQNKPKVVGFAQEGAESDWRKANTLSIQDEAKAQGIELKFSDAQEKHENQVKAIRSFIQQEVDVIVFAPYDKTGWDDVLKEAQTAHIPVIIEDRMATVSPDLYAAYVGSNFQEEGKRAADWLIKATGGKANIAVIEGVQGSDAADGRKKGFEAALKSSPNMKIIVSKPGDFQRDKGKEVAQAILKSPEGANITAMFVHNDDMALGAIQAIKEAGKKPGKDIIVVSVDGIKGAFEAIQAGELNCTVECSPLLGPQVFKLVNGVYNNQNVPKRQFSDEKVYVDTADHKFDDSLQIVVTPEVVNSRKY